MKRILVVDDDIYILEAMEELLKYSGYEVDSTLKGDDVFNLAYEFNPDLILIDIMLSGIDGRGWERPPLQIISRDHSSEVKYKFLQVLIAGQLKFLSQTISADLDTAHRDI